MKKIYFFKYTFPLLFICLANWVFAQTGTVTGRVIDETNEPLPGATVGVKGTRISAAADLNGYFKLSKVPEGKQVLVVSFIGYLPLEQTENVTGAINLTLQLK